MAKFLLAASIVWPTLLGAGWWSRTHDGPPWLTVTTYLVAGRVCHQRPERSFWSHGAPLPVCGRCTGLYLAAPIGAFIAVLSRRNRSTLPPVGWLVAAAIPSALTWIFVHADVMAVSNTARFLSALPLGAATAYYVVTVTKPPEPSAHRVDRVN